jgi:hypothetical protein
MTFVCWFVNLSIVIYQTSHDYGNKRPLIKNMKFVVQPFTIIPNAIHSELKYLLIAINITRFKEATWFLHILSTLQN